MPTPDAARIAHLEERLERTEAELHLALLTLGMLRGDRRARRTGRALADTILAARREAVQ